MLQDLKVSFTRKNLFCEFVMKKSLLFIGKYIKKRQEASTDTDENPCCIGLVVMGSLVLHAGLTRRDGHDGEPGSQGLPGRDGRNGVPGMEFGIP